MYSWGNDTSTWKSPGAYDYGDAMKPYLEQNKKAAPEERTYKIKSKPEMSLVDPKGKYIMSNSKRPIIFGIDLTLSTQSWHAEIIDRLPLFAQTLTKYDPKSETSFSAITDTKPNKWPLQVTDFANGAPLEKLVQAIFPEGKGGPGMRERYELWAYYMNTHVNLPNAKRPLMYIVADEMFYDTIEPEIVYEHIGDELQTPIPAMDVWHELGTKFDIYLLHKRYPGMQGTTPKDNLAIAQWTQALGKGRIVPIEHGARVVDIALGITAKRWGTEEDFAQSMAARQDNEGQTIVYESLRAADINIPGIKQLNAPASKKLLK